MANRKTKNNKRKNKTIKKVGGLERNHDDKSKTSVSFVFFPSAIYGNKKMLSNVNIDTTYPSFMDMANDQIMRVEEAFAYIKQNKTNVKPHIERINLGPVYPKE